MVTEINLNDETVEGLRLKISRSSPCNTTRKRPARMMPIRLCRVLRNGSYAPSKHNQTFPKRVPGPRFLCALSRLPSASRPMPIAWLGTFLQVCIHPFEQRFDLPQARFRPRSRRLRGH